MWIKCCRKHRASSLSTTCCPSEFSLVWSLSLSSLGAWWQMFLQCPTFFICPPLLSFTPAPVLVNPWSCQTRPISGESHHGYFLPCVSLIRLPLSVRNRFSFLQIPALCLSGTVFWFHSSPSIIPFQHASFCCSDPQQKANLLLIVFDYCDDCFPVSVKVSMKFHWHNENFWVKSSVRNVWNVWKQLLLCWPQKKILDWDWLNDWKTLEITDKVTTVDFELGLLWLLNLVLSFRFLRLPVQTLSNEQILGTETVLEGCKTRRQQHHWHSPPQ